MSKVSEVEVIKKNSNFLRGTLKESLEDKLTGAVFEPDQQLIKLHGFYQQDDRDRRKERAQKKLESEYSFMLRLRISGGKVTAKQFKSFFDISDLYSDGDLKITTRQTIEFHSLSKFKLKDVVKALDAVGVDSIAACGDVNRNVIASSNYIDGVAGTEIVEDADLISTSFLPETTAYQEIWLDKHDKKVEQESLYGDVYLPRKFKIALAIPPYNDVDVYAHDIGLIAILKDGKIAGYNILAGGGMGMTHGNEATYPRLGSALGYVDRSDIISVIRAILAFQRDHGNREDRKQARLKYTIDNYGLAEFTQKIEKASRVTFQAAQDFSFEYRTDIFAWRRDVNQNWHYTLFIENGRIIDSEGKVNEALRKISEQDLADIQFTTNQNISLVSVSDENKPKIEQILKEANLDNQDTLSGLRKNSMACVALNKCPLAVAEGQRYLPELVTKIENILSTLELKDEDITIRMTGCPNGCARPYLAEIGLIGLSHGKYNLHLGGDRKGLRLNKLYKSDLNEKQILEELTHFLTSYSLKRQDSESFGDFITRQNVIN